MRIALISDIHANLPALEAVLADVARRGFDAVYHLGDLVFFPTGVPSAKIAFARDGAKITQLTVADPNVMLTARRE